MILNRNNKEKAPKKHFKGMHFRVFLLIALFGAGLFLEGCAAQRCDCTDLGKRYTPPKRVHRLQRH